MEFKFHSVYTDGHHSKYYNIYKIDDDHYLAECHHFNSARTCEPDFQIIRDGDHWKPSDEQIVGEATHIADEIDRSEGHEH